MDKKEIIKEILISNADDFDKLSDNTDYSVKFYLGTLDFCIDEILQSLEQPEEKKYKKNTLVRGGKVLMKDGRILTIKALDYKEFSAVEETTYQKKSDIVEIL